MNSNKTELAYEMIKRKIINWEYPPLKDIQEDKLQEELQISRTPIREAILKLEKEGFLYIYPRKITIVTEVTSDLIEEIYLFRELNEPYLYLKAYHSMDINWFKDMKNKFINPPSNLSDEELRIYLIELDTEFHSEILNNCNNRFLINTMKIVYDHNQRIRLRASFPTQVNDNSTKEHVELIDAILSKDENLLNELSLKHIRQAKTYLIKFFSSK